MQKTEILEKLTLLLADGYKKTDIERNCNLPKNSLSSVMTGVKEMPNKWVEKFGGYFEKLEVKSDGIDQRIETEKEWGESTTIRSHSFHDITCSANPAEPMGTVGCSCEMYRRAKKAESEVQTLKIELEWRDKMIETLTEQVEGPNKPFPAPPTEKPAENTLKQEKGKEGAENGFDAKVVATYFDKEGRKTGESKPKELSPFLKSLQASKNNQK